MVTEEIKIAEAIPIEKDKEGSNATFILKLKNGKEYEYYDYLNYNVWKQIFAKYGTQNPMQEFNNMKVALRRIDLTSKEEKEILEIFNQTMNQFTYQELYDIYQSDSSEYTLYLYEYQNHQLIQRNYSKKLPKEVFQKITMICNLRAIDIVEEVPRISIGNESEFVEFLQEYMIKYYGDKIQYKDETVSENSLDNNIEKNNLKISLLKELYLVDNDGEYYDLYDETREEIQKFIVKEAAETVDISKDYVVIKAFYPNYMWYYTNNTDAVCKIFVDKYFEILERVNYDVEE